MPSGNGNHAGNRSNDRTQGGSYGNAGGNAGGSGGGSARDQAQSSGARGGSEQASGGSGNGLSGQSGGRGNPQRGRPHKGGSQGGHGGYGGGQAMQQGSRVGEQGGSRQSRIVNTRDDGPLDVDGQPIVYPPNARAFEELTSVDPAPRLTLEYPGCPASCRLIDIFCPIGRGQRALIVSPPKAGKTTLLKDIGTAILRNHPYIELVVLLVDERPEEVTDFRRHFAKVAEGLAAVEGAPPPRVRVIASSNDHSTEKHIDVATSTIARAKNMVVAGKHVVILLDSITRLGRAFNQSRKHANSGRTMSGGLDSKALEVPRALFGAARNTEPSEGGGSLTIIGSCLVDTGSQADQVIFEEFKGSGNMELILDRAVAERRIFPAMNLGESGTRKEHLLIGEKELTTISALRRQLLTMQPPVQIEKLLAAVGRTPNNAALLGM